MKIQEAHSFVFNNLATYFQSRPAICHSRLMIRQPSATNYLSFAFGLGGSYCYAIDILKVGGITN
jgi:hypothetical protein